MTFHERPDSDPDSRVDSPQGRLERRQLNEAQREVIEQLKKQAKGLVEIYDSVDRMDWRQDLIGAADVMVPSGTADLASFVMAMRYWNEKVDSLEADEKILQKLRNRLRWIQGIDAAGPAALEMLAEYGPAVVGAIVGVLGGPVGSAGGAGLGYTGGQLSHVATFAIDRSFRANELSAMVFAEHLKTVMDKARALGVDPLQIEEVRAAQQKVLELAALRRKRMFGLLHVPQKGMEKVFAGHDPDTWHLPSSSDHRFQSSFGFPEGEVIEGVAEEED